MATKNNPGKYDCYENAGPDEPMFILLARDPDAPALVREWARIREARGYKAEKVAEARACADSMETWRAEARQPERRAPVQGTTAGAGVGTVPWPVHEEAWKEFARAGHGEQDAVRIAARGGFSYRELQCALAGHYNRTFSCRERHPDVPGWEPRPESARR